MIETTNTDRIQANETRPIEVTKLGRSPLNVRRTDKAVALDELKASILAHGLMQNLVVTANGHGTYHVIAISRSSPLTRGVDIDDRQFGQAVAPAPEHFADLGQDPLPAVTLCGRRAMHQRGAQCHPG